MTTATQLAYNDVPFSSLAIGNTFIANRRVYRKAVPKFAKNGRLISNAVSITSGDVARFVDAFLVRKV